MAARRCLKAILEGESRASITKLHLAAAAGRAFEAASLIDRGFCDRFATTSPSSFSALHVAVASGSPPVVHDLLPRGMDPYRECAIPIAPTAVHLAALMGNVDTLQALVRSSADLSLDHRASGLGHSPLHAAALALGDPAQTLAFLLHNGADAAAVDKQGFSVGDWALLRLYCQLRAVGRGATGDAAADAALAAAEARWGGATTTSPSPAPAAGRTGGAGAAEAWCTCAVDAVPSPPVPGTGDGVSLTCCRRAAPLAPPVVAVAPADSGGAATSSSTSSATAVHHRLALPAVGPYMSALVAYYNAKAAHPSVAPGTGQRGEDARYRYDAIAGAAEELPVAAAHLQALASEVAGASQRIVAYDQLAAVATAAGVDSSKVGAVSAPLAETKIVRDVAAGQAAAVLGHLQTAAASLLEAHARTIACETLCALEAHGGGPRLLADVKDALLIGAPSKVRAFLEAWAAVETATGCVEVVEAAAAATAAAGAPPHLPPPSPRMQ